MTNQEKLRDAIRDWTHYIPLDESMRNAKAFSNEPQKITIKNIGDIHAIYISSDFYRKILDESRGFSLFEPSANRFMGVQVYVVIGAHQDFYIAG